jgi:hypothetical protein
VNNLFVYVTSLLTLLCKKNPILLLCLIILYTYLSTASVETDIFSSQLLSCGTQHDRIISLRGGVWAHKASLATPPFIEAPVPSQDSGRSCILMLGVLILPLSTILIFDFGIVPIVRYFLFFYFISTLHFKAVEYIFEDLL